MPPVVTAIGTVVGAVVAGAGKLTAALGLGAAVGAKLAQGAILLGASGLVQRAVGPRPGRAGLPDLARLDLTAVAAAPRKMVFGATAFAADQRYVEAHGPDQELVDVIVHLASHRSTAVESVYIGDQLAWTAAGGAQGQFAGYLWVNTILEAGAAAYHTAGTGAIWGAAQRLTGCTTARIRIKRTGNTKKTQSPFAAGLPPRVVFAGRGMPVYDPRRDSTQPGGAGPHRVDNQSTWQWEAGGVEIGRNPALQALAYLLGWRINGVVSVGLGIPPARLDIPAFAAAASICDEPVALSGGGTQPRYRADGVWPDTADPAEVLEAYAQCVGGWWDDSGGRLGLYVAVNDLAGASVTVSDDDVLDEIVWQPVPAYAQAVNVVRGLYPRPGLPTLWQPVEYPAVRLPDGGPDRTLQLDLALVQDGRQAQRLAKQALQRAQYQGRLACTLGTRGWLLRPGQPFRFSSQTLGWAEKLFRVAAWQAAPDGSVQIEAVEEHASIYAWDREEAPEPTPAVPTTYEITNNPFLVFSGPDIGVQDGATRNVFRGAWSTLANGTAFALNDEVLDQNAIWVCVLAHTKSGTNGPPTLPTQSNTWWQLKLQSGAGAPGISGAPVVIWRRSDTQPALPTAPATYTFSTGELSGLTGGWSQTMPPADGRPAWAAHASASGTGATDTIDPAEWSAPVLAVQDGASISRAVLFIYQRADSEPPAPTNSVEYTFSTGQVAGSPGGSWDFVIPPTDGRPLWVRTAAAVGDGATATILPGQWSGAIKLVEDGADGSDGRSVAELVIYRRAASAPSTPSGGTFDFGTQTLTPPSGWSASIPALDGNPLWASVGVASIIGATGSATPTWGPTVKTSEDAQSVNAIFRRAATQPATPSPSAGVPAGWSDSPPSGSDRLWVSYGSRPSPVANWTWTTPVPVEGVDGAPGPQGPTGPQGPGGAPGADGISRVEAAPFVVAAFANGTVKSGALPQTRQLGLRQGTTDLTSSASWSVLSQTNLTLSVSSAGVVTLSAISADSGSGTIRATLSAVNYDFPITARKVRDGAAPLAVSAALSFPTTSTMTTIGTTPDLALPANTSAEVSMEASWESTGGTCTGTFRLQYSTDGGGSWITMGGDEQAGAFPSEPAFIAVSRSLSSSSSARLVRFRAQALMTNASNVVNPYISNLFAGASA